MVYVREAKNLKNYVLTRDLSRSASLYSVCLLITPWSFLLTVRWSGSTVHPDDRCSKYFRVLVPLIYGIRPTVLLYRGEWDDRPSLLIQFNNSTAVCLKYPPRLITNIVSGTFSMTIINWIDVASSTMLGGELLSCARISLTLTWLKYHTSHYNCSGTCHVSVIPQDPCLPHSDIPGYPDWYRGNIVSGNERVSTSIW